MYKYVKSNTLTHCNLTITKTVSRTLFQFLSTEKYYQYLVWYLASLKKLNLLNLTFSVFQFLTSGRNSPMVKLVKWTLNSTIDNEIYTKCYIYIV